MANFLTELFGSIFTPGPTPSLLVATNASFAALEIVLLALLLATYSIHFLLLSFISAGLWWSVNWFVAELEAARQKEKEAERIKEVRRRHEEKDAEDSGTETEGPVSQVTATAIRRRPDKTLGPEDAEGSLHKRRSIGSSTGDLSTDSEWDKVEEADMGR